jgi:hypothetical protein
VTDDEAEQRKHQRVQFSLVAGARDDRDPVPVWVFKADAPSDHQPERRQALILDMSAGGMQVATAEHALGGDRYELHLQRPEDGDTTEIGIARRVWSRYVGKLGHVHGFEFEQRQASNAAKTALVATAGAHPQGPVPCLLIAI